MEKYFEGEMPSQEELDRLCVEAIRQRTLTPIVCVSTKTDVGIDELLAVLAAVLRCRRRPSRARRRRTATR